LDADRDIELVIVDGPGQVEALADKKVDGLFAHTPCLETAIVNYHAVLVADTSGGEAPELTDGQIHTLATTRQNAAQKQDMIAAVTRAIYRAETNSFRCRPSPEWLGRISQKSTNTRQRPLACQRVIKTIFITHRSQHCFIMCDSQFKVSSRRARRHRRPGRRCVLTSSGRDRPSEWYRRVAKIPGRGARSHRFEARTLLPESGDRTSRIRRFPR
jgi:hypothetical protein